MRIAIGAVCGALALAAMPASAATYMFSYGWTTPGQGQPVGTYASGTLTTDGPGAYGQPGSLNVSAISGTRGSDTINGLVDFLYADGDQEIYPTGASALDSFGISFLAGDRTYDVYAQGGAYYEYSFLTDAPDDVSAAQGYYISFFTLTPATTSDVPEAATWAMMVAGFGLIGGTLRTRSTRVHFT